MVNNQNAVGSRSEYKSIPEQLELPIDLSNNTPKSFRPIHYLGSKLRILDFIEDTVEQLDSTHGSICDLFAGSGTVSYRFSLSRTVISIDIQEYSRVICSALLNPIPSPNFDSFLQGCINSKHKKNLEYAIEKMTNHEKYAIRSAQSGKLKPLLEIIESGSIISYEMGFSKGISPELKNAIKETLSRLKSFGYNKGPASIATRYFGGVYYSYTQTAQIDTLLEGVNSLEKSKRDSILAPLLSAASYAVNTVGKQFAQPMRPRKSDGTPKPTIFKMVNRDRELDIFFLFNDWSKKYTKLENSDFPHQVIKADYSDALDNLPNDISVIYADPPYTRDHYSRYYHLLETLCLRDNPKITKIRKNGVTNLTRGLYREERHQSPFCIKSQATQAFDVLFSKTRKLEAPLVLSYSPNPHNKAARPRVLTMEKLTNLAKKYYTRVEIIHPRNISHSKLNRSDKNYEVTTNGEVLIVCESK